MGAVTATSPDAPSKPGLLRRRLLAMTLCTTFLTMTIVESLPCPRLDQLIKLKLQLHDLLC